MGQNTFVEKLNTIKNDIITTIKTKVIATLHGKEDTIYIELDKKVCIDTHLNYDCTCINRIDIIDGKVTLVDNNYEGYNVEDERISVWKLASIADQLNNNQYKLSEIINFYLE